MELNKYKLLDKESLERLEIHYNEIGSMYLRAQILDTVLDELIEQVKNNVALADVRERFSDFAKFQQDVDPEIMKVVNEKFWDML